MNNAINYITKNETIMNFLAAEARKKVASDIREKTGSGTTEKAVEILLINGNDKTILERYETYLAVGVAEAVKLRIAALAA